MVKLVRLGHTLDKFRTIANCVTFSLTQEVAPRTLSMPRPVGGAGNGRPMLELEPFYAGGNTRTWLPPCPDSFFPAYTWWILPVRAARTSKNSPRNLIHGTVPPVLKVDLSTSNAVAWFVYASYSALHAMDLAIYILTAFSIDRLHLVCIHLQALLLCLWNRSLHMKFCCESANAYSSC